MDENQYKESVVMGMHLRATRRAGIAILHMGG